MNLFDQAINGREKGENIPCSIGTAQALESLSGIGDFAARKPPMEKYDQLWVNLRTLFRNCLNALDNQSRQLVNGVSLLPALQEDWMILQGSVRQASHGATSVVLYYCTMERFEQEFPNARYKELKTERQRHEQKIEDETIRLFLEQVEEDEVKMFNVKITGNHSRSAILTHYPVDLLWRRSFSSLDLVESHTGTIKSRADWHTKLTGGRRLTNMPFNRMTLQVFGDGNVLFASMVPSVKNVIVELANENGWHSLTTPDKVRHSLKKIYDPRVQQFYLDLL